MQFVDISPANNPMSKLAVVHNFNGNEAKVTWNIEFYNKSKNVNFDGVFGYINQYLATLPKPTQESMWTLYAEIKNHIMTLSDPMGLQYNLTGLIRRLYEPIDFDKLKQWSLHHSNIRIPTTIKGSYEELEISERNQNENNYRSKTYLYDEYFDLVNLSLALRLMVPIWSEYMSSLEGTVNNHKEFHAIALITKTTLTSCEPYKRLLEYVDTINIQSKSLSSAIIEGLGSRQMPEWLLSSVIVRKLTIVELSSMDDTNNVVSVVWRYVNNIIKSIDRKHSGYIREKSVPSGDEKGGDDDSKSVVETYKMRQMISDGDLIPTSGYAEQTYRLARDTDNTVPEELVRMCKEAIELTPHHYFRPWQEDVVSWIIDKTMSAKSINNIKRQAILSCFAAVQAILYHWGHKEIALLLTAKEDRDQDGRLCGGIESRSRIPNEYVNRFKELYCFPQVQVSSRSTDRQSNVACRDIDRVALEIVRCDWVLTAPKELIQSSQLDKYIQHDNVLIVPPEIRTLLSKLVETIALKQQE